mgnify:CR=1 FL=1
MNEGWRFLSSFTRSSDFLSLSLWIRNPNTVNDTDTYIKGINRRKFLFMMDEVNIALGLPHIAVY